MLPDTQPGNTKILYFFNCLLDGMHTKALFGGIYFACGKFLFRFQLFCVIIWIVVKRAGEKDFFFKMRGRKNERLD